MKVFGIDPGSARTGYGCVQSDGIRHRMVVCGAISIPASRTFPEKLRTIHIELGILIQMMKDFEAGHKRGGTLYNFLQDEFSRVSPSKASDFCKACEAHSRTKVSGLEPPQDVCRVL